MKNMPFFEYFRLRFIIIIRSFSEINFFVLLVGVSFLVIFFFTFFTVLFNSTSFPNYITICLYGCTVVSLNINRKDYSFIKKIFSKGSLFWIKLVENIIISIPFIVILIVKEFYFDGILILVFGLFLTKFHFKISNSHVIIQPFAKFDYEWISAFRKYFLLPILFFIGYLIGLKVNSYMIGLVCAIIYSLQLCLPFEGIPEKPILIWQMKQTAVSFLKFKLIRTLAYSVFSLALFFTLILFFPDQLYVTIYAWSICLLTIVGMLFIKYSQYPSVVSIMIHQSIFIASSFSSFFAPYMLIFTIFLLFRYASQSLRALKPILNDNN